MRTNVLRKRMFSMLIILTLVISNMVVFITWTAPTAKATVVLSHNAGNLAFNVDNHTTLPPFITYNGNIMSDWSSNPSNEYCFFFFDQANYDHSGGTQDLATGRSTLKEFGTTGSDITLSFLEDDAISGNIDKSYGSFTHVKAASGSSTPVDDIRVFQTGWSMQGEDWGIIQWSAEDLTGLGMSEVRFGLRFYPNLDGDDTAQDDIDNWDGSDKIFYYSDTTSTSHLGFASADAAVPINLYIGDLEANLHFDDQIYNAISGSSSTYGAIGNIASIIGWTDDEVVNNGLTIPTGGSITRTMIIAGGNSYNDVKNAINRARQFYFSQILMITEIADEGIPRVEVLNRGAGSLNLNDFRLSVNDGSTFWTGGFWAPNPVLGRSHSVWNLAGGDAFDSTDGDTISLWNISSGAKYDEVAFGQEGIAPDPINDASIGSISRVPSGGGGYTLEWVHSMHGMTFGAQNKGNPIEQNPKIILNEVMFNPAAPEYGFIELMYIGDTARSIFNYSIVTDNFAYIGLPIILDTDDPYMIILRDDAPWLFDNGNVSPLADNIYLYDNNGTLLDMVGWSSSHTQNLTVSRIPDGYGTYQGYEDVTSVAAGWVFNQIPTIPLVLIGPQDQFGYGNPGDEIWFNFTITNKETKDDWFEILNQSLPNGWKVEIYEEDMTTKITGPIYILSGSTFNISVKVTIPSTYPIGDYDNTTIIVRSTSNQAIAFSVVAQPRVYAYLEADKSVSPGQINVLGTGYDEEATITLNVSGRGMGTPISLPQDVIFLIDNSDSMDDSPPYSDPTGERFEACRSYTYNLDENDTAAVVTFYMNDAWLVRTDTGQPAEHLSNDFVRVRENINYTSDPSRILGGTNILRALQIGRDELMNNGNNSHTWIMILLTDGGDSNYPDYNNPVWDNIIANLSELNIIVFCIGLGPQADMNLLDKIAYGTGGLSYPAPDPSYLKEIYDDIASQVSQIAGSDIDILDATPMIRDILPPWIDYVPGTFSVPPDYVHINDTGFTILEWNVSSIAIGQTWTVTFNITSTMNGYREANNFTSSRINYTDYASQPIEKMFPKTMINVDIGEPQPPELFIDIVDNFGNSDGSGDNIHLSWIPPTTPNTDYYLLYKSNSQTGFDFSSPWVNTNTDLDNWSGNDPKRTTWNDTGVALGPLGEYYYCMRTVNTGGEVSDTSRTVGFRTTTFEAKTSTFSLPLKPIQPLWTDDLLTDMAANYIKWMEPTNHVWMKHGEGEVNNTLMEIGKGFTIDFTNQTKYTFAGIPGAMIQYDNVSFGFDATPQIGNADDLTADVNSFGTVTLNWTQPLSMNPGEHQFFVHRSQTRDGFWGGIGAYDHIATIPVTNPGGLATFQDFNIAQSNTEYYYIIIPVNANSGMRGSSSYSIGVWTAGYLDQYDTMGLPLKLDTDYTTDYYCDKISGAVGINYFDEPNQRWQWHSTRMPGSAFDTLIETGFGYQISTSSPTKYSFVGI